MTTEFGRIDPDFEQIIKLCIEQLEIKYTAYGNTWIESDNTYYKKRLTNEVDEYVKSMTVESERRKLLNIINIAAMAWQTAKTNRAETRVSAMCVKCLNPLKDHDIINGYFTCR